MWTVSEIGDAFGLGSSPIDRIDLSDINSSKGQATGSRALLFFINVNARLRLINETNNSPRPSSAGA